MGERTPPARDGREVRTMPEIVFIDEETLTPEEWEDMLREEPDE